MLDLTAQHQAVYQSEREHQTSKARFLRTSSRSIPQQLSDIERRQRRISMIHENLHGSPSQIEVEDLKNVNSGVQYNVGQSQKYPVHIPTFLQWNEGDPAVNVSNLIFLLPMLTHTCGAELFPEVERAFASSYSRGTSTAG